MSSLLNFKSEGQGQAIVLIHGLFGSLGNLGLLARDLSQDYHVISVDLRNHGLSLHSDAHNYTQMAEDVNQLLAHLAIDNAIVVGHSMGGKVAMKLVELAPHRISQLIVLDMAPVAYQTRRHDNVFNGLQAVMKEKPSTRSEALAILSQHIELEGVRQFLAKSLYKQGDHLAWRFNVNALWNHYDNIIGWDPIELTHIPTLFVKGGDSDYLTADHQPLIQKQFQHVKAHVIANTGHWLHAEKPAEVLRAMRKFISANEKH